MDPYKLLAVGAMLLSAAVMGGIAYAGLGTWVAARLLALAP